MEHQTCSQIASIWKIKGKKEERNLGFCSSSLRLFPLKKYDDLNEMEQAIYNILAPKTILSETYQKKSKGRGSSSGAGLREDEAKSPARLFHSPL